MSSIFYRLDELERVQRELLVFLHGENTEGDEKSRSATYSELVVDDVPNNDTLVERVASTYEVAVRETGCLDYLQGARAAILEIAEWAEEKGDLGIGAFLRSQVEP